MPLLSPAVGAKYNSGAAGHWLPWNCSCPAWLPTCLVRPPTVTWLLDLAVASATLRQLWQPGHGIHSWHVGPGPVSRLASLCYGQPLVLNNCREAHPSPSVTDGNAYKLLRGKHLSLTGVSGQGHHLALPTVWITGYMVDVVGENRNFTPQWQSSVLEKRQQSLC